MSQIWLVGQGVIRRTASNGREESLYNVSMKEVDFHVSFNAELQLIRLLMSREDLIKLREAIDKEIPRC